MSTNLDRLNHRRNRSIAAILSYKEQHIDASLSAEQRTMLRKVVLDNVNELYEVAADIIDDNGGVLFNELYQRKIDEVHAGVIEIAASLSADR